MKTVICICAFNNKILLLHIIVFFSLPFSEKRKTLR